MRRSAVLTLALLALGWVPLTLYVLVGRGRRDSQPPSPPAERAAEVPTIYDGPRIVLDPRATYDVFASFRDESVVYRGCRIVGFTGRPPNPSPSGGAGGLSGGLSSGGYGAGSSTGAFDGWLVLSLVDGRRAYLPTTAVERIADAAPEPR